MNRTLLWLFLALAFLWFLFGSWLQSRHCNCATAVVPPVVAPAGEAAPLKTLSILDSEKNFSSRVNDNLLFGLNSCDFKTPISDSLQAVFSAAANHLNANENRLLVLTGQYGSAENSTCRTNANIGAGRAETVKELLVGLGAPPNRIRIQSNRQEVQLIEGDIVGGVAYDFLEGNADAVEDRLRAGNLTLYFETNARNIDLSLDQQKYFEDIRYFLTLKPEAQFTVIGHTDNKGAYNFNKRLSRKRAEFVRDYMISQGINADNLSAEGEGPDQPIETNDTEEGRAKNRRVAVSFVQ